MGNRIGVTYRFEKKVLAYEDALRAVSLEPVRLQAGAPCSLDGLDGLMITGGTDVDPSLYGQPPDPSTDEPDPERDTMERQLLESAMARDLPVLCICRGFQLLNVVRQGSLVQNLSTADLHRRKGVHDAHPVEVLKGTRLAELIEAGEHVVNSRHHQGVVDGIGKGLTVSAKAPDGVVEAVEISGVRFGIAVQWHPEDRVATAKCDRLLFEGFAKAVSV